MMVHATRAAQLLRGTTASGGTPGIQITSAGREKLERLGLSGEEHFPNDLLKEGQLREAALHKRIRRNGNFRPEGIEELVDGETLLDRTNENLYQNLGRPRRP